MALTFIALVRARRAEIAQQRAALAEEDAELEITERQAVRLEGAGSGPSEEMAPVSKDPLASKFTDPKPSIKMLITRTLKQSAEAWMPDAGSVWDAIRRDYGVEINKNSFYPQLASLVNDDKTVIRDGKKVALIERLTKREIREISDKEALY